MHSGLAEYDDQHHHERLQVDELDLFDPGRRSAGGRRE